MAGSTSSGTSRSSTRPLGELVDGVVVANFRREPALELPADARRQRRRGERALVAPAPGQPLTPLGLGLDHHASARPSAPRRHELLGERLGRERSGLDVHGGWIQLGGLDELGGGGAGGAVALSSPRASLYARTGRPEATEHGAVGQRRERFQRAQAEPDEQVGQSAASPGSILEHRDRPGREKPGDSPGGTTYAAGLGRIAASMAANPRVGDAGTRR